MSTTYRHNYKTFCMGNRKFYSNFMNVIDNRISKKKEECDVLKGIMCS